MSDTMTNEEQKKATKMALAVDNMSEEELRTEVLRLHSQTRGLNRRVSELDTKIAEGEPTTEVKAQRTLARLEIREKVYESAMQRGLPLGAVKRLAVDSIDQVDSALDELEDAWKAQRAEERRAYDAAHGRSSATMGPGKQRYGASSYSDLLQMDNRQLEHMSPRALDHILNREIAKGGK